MGKTKGVKTRINNKRTKTRVQLKHEKALKIAKIDLKAERVMH